VGQEGQVIRLGAALCGKVDLAKLFEARSDAVKVAKADVEETKKKAK
jgi:hypothetical protein